LIRLLVLSSAALHHRTIGERLRSVRAESKAISVGIVATARLEKHDPVVSASSDLFFSE
jgi:hypothetical protein